MSRRSMGLLTALSLMGCRPDPGAAAKSPEDLSAVAGDRAAVEHSLADRIDPGPGPGLLEGMPKWAATQYGLDNAPSDVAPLMNALGQWRALPEGMAMQQRLGLAVELGLASLAVERGAPDAVTDRVAMAALAQLYGTFDVPAMFDPRGLFGSMMGLVAQNLSQRPDTGSPDEARAAELLTWLGASLGRLPRLHRRMAARMLRETPDHPDLPDVVDRVAAASSQEPEVAIALRQYSVKKRDRFATAVHHRALAEACYVGLDLACGDAAFATAERLADGKDAAFAKDLAAAKVRREQAQRLLSLAGAKAVDQQLERAAVLVDMGRHRDGREAYAAIRKQRPRDARAVYGEVHAELHGTFDFKAAFKSLEAAGTDLEHRDRKYLELAIGIRCMQLAYVVLPEAMTGGVDGMLRVALPMLEPVRRDVAELAALGVDKGLVVAFLLGLGEEMLPAVRASDAATMMATARGLLPRALELRRKIPTSRYGFDVMLAAAQFSTDERGAKAAVAEPVPIEDATLAMRAAMTRVALAVTFGDKVELAAAQAQIEAWPESFGAAARTRALARVDTVQWRMGADAASRDRALARYETLLPQLSTAADVTDLSNFAVLLVDADRRPDAVLVLGRALAIEATAEAARLHFAVTSAPIDVAALESLVDNAEGQIAMAALGWLAVVDTRAGARAKWAARRAEKLRTPALRARELPNSKWLGVGSALQIGIGYSTVSGLEINIDSGPTPMIYVAPPAVKRRGR